jgi:hypothetical protein
MGAATTTGAVVGGLAVAAVLGTTIALGGIPPASDQPPVVVAAIQDAVSPTAPALETPTGIGPKSTDPDHIPSLVGGVTAPLGGVTDVVDDTVQDVVQTVTQPVTVTVSVSGTGTPGGRVALTAAGAVYATTTVGAGGGYSISAGGIPQAVGSVSVVQTVDPSLLGLVGGVLNVLKPLTISSSSGGLPAIAVG